MIEKRQNKKEKLIEYYSDAELMFADGFDNAIIGISDSWCGNGRPHRVVYSYEHCIVLLMKQNMSRDEALEYFEFNVAGAYMGEKTPIFVEMVWRKI